VIGGSQVISDVALSRSRDNPHDRELDVIVVGGGQAGLAMAWHLAERGLSFLVLEAGAEVGDVWRSRWDSLTLFTPAQYDSLPGMAFPGESDTYPTKDQVAAYLRAYAASSQLPVRLNARASALRRVGDGFEVTTADQVFRRGRSSSRPDHSRFLSFRLLPEASTVQ
jgi:cation diffusion facilitator CzcD-associated flavoprotein CzcO